jgi:hypothetical protein
MTNPTTIYAGTREAVMAEAGTPSFYEGKYLIQPDGNAAYDAEGASNKKELRELVAAYREAYPTIQVIWL